MTQAELARALGVSRNTIARWERAELAIEHHELVELALDRLDNDLHSQTEGSSRQERAPHNLPHELNSFVGREQELTELNNLLRTTRLLTLTGVGGAGKTRLAVRFGRQILTDYTDGIWFVDLAPITDRAAINQTAAAVLGLHEQTGQSVAETIAATLGQRHTLLILDNCEHVVEGAAELVANLLRATARLRVIATSREPLNLTGETIHTVSPLAVPNPNDQLSWQQVLQYPSARLLLERSTARSTYRGEPEEAEAVAQICWRLDGLPLSLELAAARLQVLGPTQLAGRLKDAFGLLVTTHRDVPDRQQTLRATLDWSYALLSADERILFSRLAIFAGGWTLEACEAVAGGGGIDTADVLDVLSQLVAKSLVIAEPVPGGGMRYRLLETVRQYALERLERSTEVPALRAAHRQWFLACAERFNGAAHGPAAAAEFAHLDQDLDNLRAALDWSAKDASDLDYALTTAGRLRWFWMGRGYYREGRTYLERLLAAASTNTSAAARAEALLGAGMLAWSQAGTDDVAAARQLLSEAANLARALGDKKLLGNALGGLARAVRDEGDHAGSRLLLEEALQLAEAEGDLHSSARSLNGLGMLARKQGNFPRALDYFERSLARSRELGDQFGMATQLTNMAVVAYRQSDIKAAATLVCQALAMRRDQHVRWDLPVALDICAGVAARCYWPEKAARLYGAADAVRHEVAVPSGPEEREYEPDYRRDLVSARTQLGAVAFGLARSAGRRLSIDQIVQEAKEIQQGTRTMSAASFVALTPRETEVARLIARGLTNYQIAAHLVITEATAAKHVEHILDKLRFASRVEIATWVVTEQS
jgi:non-specific serine/threonine protein kinase